MKFEGHVWKRGRFWLAEIPALEYVTQGYTREEAYEMAVDIVETGVDQKGFKATLERGSDGRFWISANQKTPLLALFIRRQRQRHGLSVRQAAERFSSSSPNSLGAYEQGKRIPSVLKLDELVRTLSPQADLIIGVKYTK